MGDAQTLGILSSPFLSNILLPFLLVFVVIFAILEKTELLGKEKRYANLIISIIIGLLFIGVQSVVGFTLRLLPLVAVFLVILLGYFLIFGFIDIHKVKGLQIALGIIFGLAFIAAVLWAAGVLDKLTGSITAGTVGVVVFLLILGGAVALVLSAKGKQPSG